MHTDRICVNVASGLNKVRRRPFFRRKLVNNSDNFELFLCSLESEQELLVMFDLFVLAIFQNSTKTSKYDITVFRVASWYLCNWYVLEPNQNADFGALFRCHA